jgi:DnaJ-domain-containing protein 1
MDSVDPSSPSSFAETARSFAQGNFGLLQIALSVGFLLLWFWSRSREESKSRFKLREADRNLKFERGEEAARRTADARAAGAKKPLRLEGIVSDGAPHEVLGISALATEAEIQKAFKDRMKRYHPDRIGRPGSPEWTDATKIAEALNRARNEMLERLKRRS